MATNNEQYKSAYSTVINDLVNKAINRQPFQYDPATDAAYQSYAKQYARLGDEAARDTLADVSANTGGLASSYAVTAAQQARNKYNEALTDKIPALMEAAYNKYRNEYNDTLAGIGTLQGLDDSAYNRFATDRGYNRGVYENDRDYNRSVFESDRGYNRGVYESDRDFNEGVRQYNQNYALDKQAQQFEQMLNRWTTLGYATKDVAKFFGIPEGTKTDDSSYRWAQYALQQATAGSSGGSGGGRRGGSGGSDRGGKSPKSSSGGSPVLTPSAVNKITDNAVRQVVTASTPSYYANPITGMTKLDLIKQDFSNGKPSSAVQKTYNALKDRSKNK